MKRIDCLRLMTELLTDQLVVCNLGGTSEEWWELNQQRPDHTFYMRSSMGLVSSMALGLALSLPRRGIWALDGDGSLAMNLGTLLTTARLAPPNLLHLVWLNRVYEATGGQQVPFAAGADLAAMARGAGIGEAHRFQDLDAFREAMPALVRLRQHVFVVAEVEPTEQQRERRTIFPVEMAQQFENYVAQTEGFARI